MWVSWGISAIVRGVFTGATASLYVPVVLLCPPLLPLVRALAAVWPDAGMRTVRFPVLLSPLICTCHAPPAAAMLGRACSRGAGICMPFIVS